MSRELMGMAEFHPGGTVVMDGGSPHNSFAAVFEDDGETGYLYALDTSLGSNQIIDALHIYDVADVQGREGLWCACLYWSSDGLRVVLEIDGKPRAGFDFATFSAYSRTRLPASPGKFTHYGWSDDFMGFF